jgi:hypothetical protein
MQADPQLLDHAVRQCYESKPLFLSLGLFSVIKPLGIINGQIATAQHLERLCSKPQFLVHALIVCAREVRDANFQERADRPIGKCPLTKGLAPDPGCPRCPAFGSAFGFA